MSAKIALPATITAFGAMLGVALAIVATTMLGKYGWASVAVAGIAAIGILLFIAVFYYALLGRAWAISIYYGLLIFLMDSSFRQKDLQDVSGDWQTYLKLALWLGALVIGIFHFPKMHKLLLRSFAVVLLCFGIWSLCTIVYSDSFSLSFGAAFSFFCLIIFSAAAVHKLTLKQILITIAASLTIFMIGSWLAYIAIPSLGKTTFESSNGIIYRFSGLAGKPTNLGRLAGLLIGILFLLVRLKFINWKLTIIPALLAAGGLVLSETRTATLAVIAAISLIYFRKRPKLFYAGLTIMSAVFAAIYFFPSSFSMDTLLRLVSRSGNIDEIFTLTARTNIWQFVLEKIQESPWIGYGYASSRLLISEGYASKWGWTTGSSHNMFLQCMLTTGLIGTVMAVLLLLRQGFLLVKRPNDFRDFVFIFIVINGFAEAMIFGAVPGVFTLIWMTTVYWGEKRETNIYSLDQIHSKT